MQHERRTTAECTVKRVIAGLIAAVGKASPAQRAERGSPVERSKAARA